MDYSEGMGTNDEVAEPWTQKVRRAMSTFAHLMDFNPSPDLIASNAINQGTRDAFNTLGQVLNDFIDIYEKQTQELWQAKADIDGHKRTLRFKNIAIARQGEMINKLHEEVILVLLESEDNRSLAGDHEEQKWTAQSRANAAERRARSFQKAYEDLAKERLTAAEQGACSQCGGAVIKPSVMKELTAYEITRKQYEANGINPPLADLANAPGLAHGDPRAAYGVTAEDINRVGASPASGSLPDTTEDVYQQAQRILREIEEKKNKIVNDALLNLGNGEEKKAPALPQEPSAEFTDEDMPAN